MTRRWMLIAAAAALFTAGCDDGGGGGAGSGAGAPGGPSKVEESAYKSTPGGVKYAILKEGQGEGAGSRQAVTVHYTGWLQSNGEKFDSSVGKEPFQFVVENDAVIRGWHEGVKGMKEGEKRQLVIPPALGYREEGQGPIPPNATLVFEIELLKITRKGQPSFTPTGLMRNHVLMALAQ